MTERMARIQLDIATGTTDGVNKTFYTALPYISGTLAVYRNGLVVAAAQDDGFIETSFLFRRFDMKIAPQDGDLIQALYSIDSETMQFAGVIQGIHGKIKSKGSLKAKISDTKA